MRVFVLFGFPLYRFFVDIRGSTGLARLAYQHMQEEASRLGPEEGQLKIG
jgi:hypothetical protein